jgi:ubiquinone/menaquinone biosynthesis C-methylase UbiE
MPTRRRVTFGHRATVAAYDELQVPTFFLPWAESLAGRLADWRGKTVLDLAAGSGIVAAVLAPRVGPTGRVIAADISEEMLARARRRLADLQPPVELLRSAAHPLELPDASVDVVVCQQGFQFFPDRQAAAREMRRVLRPGGRVIAACWRSLAECEYFCRVRDALVAMGRTEPAEKLHTPFDHLPADELRGHFVAAGFAEVRVEPQALPATFAGGLPQAVATAWSTVVGPELEGMTAKEQDRFRMILTEMLRELSEDGRTVVGTVANVLTAARAEG